MSGITVTGYKYTDPSDEVSIYDDEGRLQSVIDPTGITQSLTYDTNNRLYQVTTTTGESLTFSYDASNRIESITDHTGRVWLYTYDANNNLASVTYPDDTPTIPDDNPKRIYHYNESAHTSGANLPNHLTGITDERGIRYATYEYYADGRAKSSTHAGNAQRVDISYNDTDGTRTVTNSRGKVSTYSTTTQLGTALVTGISGPGCSTCGTGNSTYQYDPNTNDLLSKTENGITTAYGDYDTRGNKGFMVEAYVTADARRTEYTYDARYHSKVKDIIEPSVYNHPGRTLSYSTDADGYRTVTDATGYKRTAHQYDGFGNILQTTVSGYKPDGTPVSRTTTYQYNGPLHQLSRIDGPRTDVADITTLDYHPIDHPDIGHRARLSRIIGPTGLVLRDAISYTPTGKVQSEQRPNGLTLDYTYYPGNDRLESLTESAGAMVRTTRWTYLPTGEVQTITTGDGTAAASTLTFGYDDARRLTRITDGLGHYIEYVLDTEGNVEREDTRDSAGSLKRRITRTFDDYNRLDLLTRGDAGAPGMTTETADYNYNPDGTLDTVTDGHPSTTKNTYDNLKRLATSTAHFNGADSNLKDTLTRYQYNVHDQLTQVIDPNTNATTYTYDDLGNLLSTTSPDTGLTRYTYDAAGNLQTRTDAKGQLFTYSYDAANRLTTLTAPNSNDNLSYVYDNCANGQGRLCKVIGAGNTVFYTYTPFGEVETSQGSDSLYDAAGRLSRLTYPSGVALDFDYDAAGQVNNLTLTHNGQSQILASNIVHAPFGPVTALSFGNGKALLHSLDSAYRSTAQTVAGALDLAYPQYDANGNLRTRTNSAQSPAVSDYSYDVLDRLDTASGAFGNRDYDHDKNGNRTRLIADGQTTDYDYEPLGTGTQNNRLRKIGATDVLTDDNGNTLSNGVWSYDYTAHNRLKEAKDNTAVVGNYAYNGLGQRVQKSLPTGPSGPSARLFLYGPAGELLAEANGGGSVLTEYVYLDGTLIALYQPDDDGDGLTNAAEAAAGTLPASVDRDGDGLSDPDEWFVTGTDAQNPDSDGDGVNDGAEAAAGLDPLDPAVFPGDGDINADGAVNAGDLVLMMRIVTGALVPTAAQQARADMNRDGVVNLPDMLKLQRKVLGIALNEWLHQWPTQALAKLDALGERLAALRIDPIKDAHAAITNGRVYYVHTDHLGTPQAVTDQAGSVVWRAVYDPFGKATLTVNAIELNVRLPGQYYDQETGLHYNWFRYYDPSTGRYLNADPIGQLGGINLFTYSLNNPIRFTDPEGLNPLAGAIGGGTIAGPPGAVIGGLIGFGIGIIIGNELFNEDGNEPTDPPIDPPADDPQQCEDDEDDNCEALYQSILQTCAGLTGRKRFKCFEAARIARDQCYQERNR